MKIMIWTSLISFFISGAAFANFPGGFNTEKMRECISAGGISSDYQGWQKGARSVASTEKPEDEEPEEEPDCD